MKKALIKNGSHERPMLAVLVRYNIGRADQYGRGRWITERDLLAIEAGMAQDKTAVMFGGERLVNGSSIHNHVALRDFRNKFQEA